jgi:hypothetical protein
MSEAAMKTSPLAVVGFICLALAGCRTDPSVTLLERQNRQMEDEIYRLRGVIQDYEEGGTPVNCTTDEAADAAPLKRDMRRTRESTAAPSESLAPRSRNSSSRGTVQPPIIEVPGEALPSGSIPDTLKRPAGIRARGEPGKLEVPEVPKQIEGPSGPNLSDPLEPGNNRSSKTSKIRPTGGFEPVAKADSKDVGQLVLNRMLTGGYSAEGRSGDSGVLAVLEPRDAKGRRLEAPGDVAIVLMDPSKTGPEAKLARWDFPAGETAKLFRGNGIGRGMYVECPWPDRPPENNRLHLFVRYTTRDGRKFEADQSVEVALPGEKISRWTPAESELQPVAASDREISSHQSDTATAAAQSDATDSPAADSPPPRRFRSMRAASRTNSPALQRPVWSPERF